MSIEPLTYVSVGFESELDLLRLQARSMRIHLPLSRTAAILVIDNSARGMSRHDREQLLSEYGGLLPLVTVLRPADITTVPSTVGWRSQQILKLCVATHVRSARYVVLDAKNHFVASLDDSYFTASDGRMRASFYSYVDHPLGPDLRRVLHYSGLEAAAHVEHFPATITPFVLDRALTIEMVQDIELTSGRPFAQEFVHQELTEFFLCSAWLLGRGDSLDELYAPYPASCPVVWPKKTSAAAVQAAIASSRERRTPIFTVHRRAFPLLDPQACEQLAGFWTESALFDSDVSAMAFIQQHRLAAAGNDRRQRVRDLPHKARQLLRRGRKGS